jgi:hypothetical protein
MKTISIKNPHAYLIAKGIKDVENRTWKTSYRGKILIHASQKWDTKTILTREQFDLLPSYDTKIPSSAIIGEVEIIDCIKDSQSIWAMDGHFHWVLANAVLFETPILNVKGKLSFWDYPLHGLIDCVCGHVATAYDWLKAGDRCPKCERNDDLPF